MSETAVNIGKEKLIVKYFAKMFYHLDIITYLRNIIIHQNEWLCTK